MLKWYAMGLVWLVASVGMIGCDVEESEVLDVAESKPLIGSFEDNSYLATLQVTETDWTEASMDQEGNLRIP